MKYSSWRYLWRLTGGLLLIVTCITLAGCLARPTIDKGDGLTHAEQSEKILSAIVEKGQTGDWLITRGYHATDVLVSNVTGIPLSHVAIYNGATRKVIEAEGKGVHLSTIEDFVDKSYRVLIVRPRWRTDENGHLAWAEAEKLVGSNYDFLGTIGFSYPRSYYCSELAILIYKQWYSGKERFPSVIKPGEMFLFGRVVHDSLPRDEME
jgi:hypothetical protein